MEYKQLINVAELGQMQKPKLITPAKITLALIGLALIIVGMYL